MSNTVIYGSEVRDAFSKGLNTLANTVKLTLGPAGKNVYLAQTGQVTKDGVSVARAVTLSDMWENEAASLIKGVAIKAEKEAGDGTTTSTVLSQAMISWGLNKVDSKLRPGKVIHYLETAVKAAKESLSEQVTNVNDVSDLIQVATISANGDETIGTIIGETVNKVGEFGIINLKDGVEDHDVVDYDTGYTIARGLSHSIFRNHRTGFKSDTANVIILSGGLETVDDVDLIYNKIIEGNTNQVLSADRPTLLIVKDIEDVASQRIGVINNRHTNTVIPLRAPSAGRTQAQYIEDIAEVTHSKIFTMEELKENAIQDGVGAVTDLNITDNETVFNYVLDVSDYIEKVRADMDSIRSGYERERLRERIARLTGGVATIYVGGYTESEMKERKDRFDDAKRATQGALLYGTVRGGGYALLEAYNSTKVVDKEASEFLTSPIRQILANAEYTDDEVEEVLTAFSKEKCIDVLMGEYLPKKDYRVIDPYHVTTTALDTALSIAKLVITTDAMVAKDNRPAPSYL